MKCDVSQSKGTKYLVKKPTNYKKKKKILPFLDSGATARLAAAEVG